MSDYKTNLKVKSDFLQLARAFLIKNKFLEIQTPKISFMPTDQNDHLFKINYFGAEAYLIQSPQFYKQAYVINGINSVFEIAPVFRAEPKITRRHLSEFISLDVESSKFKNLEDIISFESNLIKFTTNSLSKKYAIKPIKTFKIVKYNDIKKLLNLDKSVPLMNEHEIEISKSFRSDGIFVIYYPVKERAFYYEDYNNFSQSYDLFVDGLEITSGGLRITSKEKLIKKMRDDNINPNDYSPYLNLFNGTVPMHGGFAIGVERLISKYLNITDVVYVNPFSKKPNTKEEVLRWKQ